MSLQGWGYMAVQGVYFLFFLAEMAEPLLKQYNSCTITDLSEYDAKVEDPPISEGDLRREQDVANQDILAAYSTFPGLPL